MGLCGAQASQKKLPDTQGDIIIVPIPEQIQENMELELIDHVPGRKHLPCTLTHVLSVMPNITSFWVLLKCCLLSLLDTSSPIGPSHQVSP